MGYQFNNNNIFKMKNFWSIIITFIVTFLILCFLLPSCSVLKKSHSEKEQSSKVVKSNLETSDSLNSGNIKKSNSISKEDFDWWRTTFINSPQKENDSSGSVTNVYPSTVIYEGGKGSKESDVSSFDSSWFLRELQSRDLRIDSLSTSKEVKDESKKTTTDWKLYGIIAILAFLFVDKVTKFMPLKIVRK